MRYTGAMSRRITQRELRNQSARLMRALDKGEAFTVTRNGVPVGELLPVKPRVFVAADVVPARAADRAGALPSRRRRRGRPGSDVAWLSTAMRVGSSTRRWSSAWT